MPIKNAPRVLLRGIREGILGMVVGQLRRASRTAIYVFCLCDHLQMQMGGKRGEHELTAYISLTLAKCKQF